MPKTSPASTSPARPHAASSASLADAGYGRPLAHIPAWQSARWARLEAANSNAVRAQKAAR